MSDVIIKAENLHFAYEGSKEHSLNGLSLEIKKGDKVAFMGANGSGKSTFFLCCNGIHRPSSGTLYFDGKPIDYSRKELLELRKQVGIVFQDPDNQLFSASVYQEISFGIMNMGVTEQVAKEAVEKIMKNMDLTQYRYRPTHALSGGQKKMVSIADVLVMNPKVVILDEPAAALDPKHEELVNKAIDQMTAEGITVLMSTHDVDRAFAWADDIVVLDKGKLLKQGDPTDVFMDKEVLKKAHLKMPAALALFLRLREKGILDADLPVPRTLEELEGYLSGTYENGHMENN